MEDEENPGQFLDTTEPDIAFLVSPQLASGTFSGSSTCGATLTAPALLLKVNGNGTTIPALSATYCESREDCNPETAPVATFNLARTGTVFTLTHD